MGHRRYARQMLRAVADWNRARRVPLNLYVVMSIDCVRGPELMELLRGDRRRFAPRALLQTVNYLAYFILHMRFAWGAKPPPPLTR